MHFCVSDRVSEWLSQNSLRQGSFAPGNPGMSTTGGRSASAENGTPDHRGGTENGTPMLKGSLDSPLYGPSIPGSNPTLSVQCR